MKKAEEIFEEKSTYCHGVKKAVLSIEDIRSIQAECFLEASEIVYDFVPTVGVTTYGTKMTAVDILKAESSKLLAAQQIEKGE